jgi:predicted dehydrogenase
VSATARAFAQRYDVPKVYGSWTELLRYERPDALWVAPSWDQIDHMLLALIESGIPCLLEKPAALSADRLREAVAIARRNGTRALVGYNRRFYEFVPRVRAFLAKARLRAIEAHLPEPLPRTEAGVDKALLHALWLVKGSHLVDLLYYLVGKLTVVTMVRGIDEAFGMPTAFNGLLQTPDGIPVHLIANWEAPERYSLTFYCDDSILRISPLERLQIYQGVSVEEASPERPIRTFLPRLVEEQAVDMTYKPGFLAQAKNFLDSCVTDRSPNAAGCTLEDALAVTELCEEIGGCHG